MAHVNSNIEPAKKTILNDDICVRRCRSLERNAVGRAKGGNSTVIYRDICWSCSSIEISKTIGVISLRRCITRIMNPTILDHHLRGAAGSEGYRVIAKSPEITMVPRHRSIGGIKDLCSMLVTAIAVDTIYISNLRNSILAR